VRFILNIIWLALAGIRLAISYVIASALLAITIIGIPFAVQSFKLAGYALWPFGRALARLCITIIGIPLGVGSFKMAGAALAPFGRKVVKISELTEAQAGSISVG
jgi:uncharacterized membrane protein YccF (DUF307 family)